LQIIILASFGKFLFLHIQALYLSHRYNNIFHLYKTEQFLCIWGPDSVTLKLLSASL
jgi:hypothetical protein